MKNKIFLFFLAIFIGISTIFGMISISAQSSSGSNTAFSLFGKIMGLEKWKGGTVGNVQFLTDEVANNNPVTIDRSGNLHGNFWVWTVGWVTFNHNHTNSNYTARIECPEDIFTTSVKSDSIKNLVCPAKWYAWSQNSGWISLDKGIHGTGSWVYFNPNSANLEWFAWSQSIGWVPMITSGTWAELIPEIDNNWEVAFTGSFWTDRYNTWATASNINFIGKVVAIGNTAGTKIFDIQNAYWYHNQQNIASSYTTVQHANLFNRLRGNVAQMVRNIPSDIDNPNNTNDKKFIYSDKYDYCISDEKNENGINISCNWYNNDNNDGVVKNINISNFNKDTIIVKWKDIIIDTDFVYNNVNSDSSIIHPENIKWIIALKNDSWSWWNIYITENVSQIYAYIVAEWSIFSGEKNQNWTIKLYNSEKNNPFNIPNKQLYINWLLISKNTIGWQQQDVNSSKCPILTSACSYWNNNVHTFDFNYFRQNNPISPLKFPTATSLPASRSGISDLKKIKEAIMIIDYNNNILINPPIGFEIFK